MKEACLFRGHSREWSQTPKEVRENVLAGAGGSGSGGFKDIAAAGLGFPSGAGLLPKNVSVPDMGHL